MDDRVMSGAHALREERRDVRFAKKADDLEAIQKAVDDAAAVSGGLWLSYLFVFLYIAIAAGAVTHADLLLQRPVHLPALNTDLPLLAFFALAPFLFLVMHAYTLAHFVMLGKKALRFHEQLQRKFSDSRAGSGEDDSPPSSAKKETHDKLRWLLPSNIFVQILAGPREMRRGWFGFILWLIAFTTLAIFPVLLLLLLQSEFLPYHSTGITWAQRAALFLDILLLWFFWPRIFSPRGVDGAGPSTRLEARAFCFVLAALFSLAALWLSLVVAAFPGEWQEKAPDWMDPPWWPDISFTDKPDLSSEGKKAAKYISMRQFLYGMPVSATTLRRRGPFSNTLVLAGFSLYKELKIDEPEKLKWKEYLIDLRGRDLKQAELSRADLSKADLTDANLQGADLDGIQLQGASLDRAQLQGASLRGARLEAASLAGAQLQGAWLRGARLKAASLEGAHLEGAELIYAQLQAASLKGAQLQGALLWDADLQGAVLDNAEIEAASFSRSFLWRSSWAGVDPQAIGLQEVKWGPKDWLRAPDTDFSTNDLSFTSSYGEQATRPHLPDDIRKYYDYLVASLDGFGPAMLEAAKQRVDRLNCKNPKHTLASCDAGEKLPTQVREQQDALKKASVKEEDPAYQKALAAILQKISCASGGGTLYVLGGLIQVKRFEATGSEAIALVDSILRRECPISGSLPNEVSAALHRIRGNAYADKQDFGRAIADYSAAIEFDQENTYNYETRGVTYVQNGDYSRAIADMSKLIESDPDNVRAYYYRGFAYENKREFAYAFADFTKAIDLAPTSFAYETRGRAYADNGSYDAALRDFKDAIDLDHKSASALIGEGGAYANKGVYGHAIDDYNKAINVNKNNSLAYIGLGDVIAAKLDYAKAFADYKEAIRLAREDPSARARALRHRATAYEEEHDYGHAVDDLRNAINPADTFYSYSVLELYLAQARSGVAGAADKLKENAQNLGQHNWPYPAIELFLGNKTPEEVLRDAPATPVDRCDAKVYAGEWYLLQHDPAKAQEALGAAVATCPKGYVSFAFARAELTWLQNGAPKPAHRQ